MKINMKLYIKYAFRLYYYEFVFSLSNSVVMSAGIDHHSFFSVFSDSVLTIITRTAGHHSAVAAHPFQMKPQSPYRLLTPIQ